MGFAGIKLSTVYDNIIIELGSGLYIWTIIFIIPSTFLNYMFDRRDSEDVIAGWVLTPQNLLGRCLCIFGGAMFLALVLIVGLLTVGFIISIFLMMGKGW